MSKNRNDQIKSLWHAIVTWSRQHWPWGTQVVRCFQHGGEFCCQSTCHQLFVFVIMTLFGRIRINYSDHYSAPKRIRIEYSVHPYHIHLPVLRETVAVMLVSLLMLWAAALRSDRSDSVLDELSSSSPAESVPLCSMLLLKQCQKQLQYTPPCLSLPTSPVAYLGGGALVMSPCLWPGNNFLM